MMQPSTDQSVASLNSFHSAIPVIQKLEDRSKNVCDLIEKHGMEGSDIVYDSELRVILKKHAKVTDYEISHILDWIHTGSKERRSVSKTELKRKMEAIKRIDCSPETNVSVSLMKPPESRRNGLTAIEFRKRSISNQGYCKYKYSALKQHYESELNRLIRDQTLRNSIKLQNSISTGKKPRSKSTRIGSLKPKKLDFDVQVESNVKEFTEAIPDYKTNPEDSLLEMEKDAAIVLAVPNENTPLIKSQKEKTIKVKAPNTIYEEIVKESRSIYSYSNALKEYATQKGGSEKYKELFMKEAKKIADIEEERYTVMRKLERVYEQLGRVKKI